jgi:predicted nucleotidyltransferase
MIEEILPKSSAKLEILETIMSNPGINITGIIKKTKTSPNLVIQYINTLVDANILKEERKGGTKKTHIRFLYPNLNQLGIKVFSLVETDKRIKFLKKYPEFKPICNQIIELAQNKNIDFVLIFGSFARFVAEKDSDVDILIVSKNKDFENELSDILITLNREYSVKVVTESEFKENLKKKSLYQDILKNHVLVYGENTYLEIVKDWLKN